MALYGCGDLGGLCADVYVWNVLFYSATLLCVCVNGSINTVVRVWMDAASIHPYNSSIS